MRALGLVLAVALAAGCGGDDDGGERVDTTPRDAHLARFESPRIAFTFNYPKRLVAEKRARAGVLGGVAVERGSPLNAIRVRRTARRELKPERYLDEFQRDFEGTVGTVEAREERIGDLDAGVLEIEDTIELGGESVEFESTSYFFSGDGQTWQVECVADDEHSQQIADACQTVLRSVDFAG